MSRHLPTYSRCWPTWAGSVEINTSAWSTTKTPTFMRIGPQLYSFTAAEARLIGQTLIEAADHHDAVRQPTQEAAA